MVGKMTKNAQPTEKNSNKINKNISCMPSTLRASPKYTCKHQTEERTEQQTFTSSIFVCFTKFGQANKRD